MTSDFGSASPQERSTSSLAKIAETLRQHPNVLEKLHIARAYKPSLSVSEGIAVGDDTAAIPDGDGFLLFAAEGMIEGFIARDPWFAGYCAVMVNLSDIAAMGGRATAIVDVIWAHEDSPIAKQIWAGLQAASKAYGVPIVGGHTTRFPIERTPLLAAAVIGRAKKIISSFTAKPGELLLMAVDLRATYRGEGTGFWNASTGAPDKRLRGDLEILPQLAEEGLVSAGKDISNGGVLGTLTMLLATSRCGAIVNVDALPRPVEATLEQWLLSFPSFGFLLTTAAENVTSVIARFAARELSCAVVGRIEATDTIVLTAGDERVLFAKISPAPECG